MKREQLSEGIGDISESRAREPFSIPKSASAKPKRVERGTSRAASGLARVLAKKLSPDSSDSLPDLPQVDRGGGIAKTYVLTRGQRELIERHALQRFELGLTGRIDYSAPLRDIVEFFMAHEKEGNAFIANKYKNEGNR